MFALKESPMKMLYGNTKNAATIPDNIPIPQNLNNALNALSCPEPILPHKRTFISALNSGPFYENGHLILGNSGKDMTADGSMKRPSYCDSKPLMLFLLPITTTRI